MVGVDEKRREEGVVGFEEEPEVPLPVLRPDDAAVDDPFDEGVLDARLLQRPRLRLEGLRLELLLLLGRLLLDLGRLSLNVFFFFGSSAAGGGAAAGSVVTASGDLGSGGGGGAASSRGALENRDAISNGLPLKLAICCAAQNRPAGLQVQARIAQVQQCHCTLLVGRP